MTRVSIVEDQPEVLNSLIKAIDRTKDMTCVSGFDNAEDALLQLPKQRPDIVLMDIGLPKMDGIECMYRIKLVAPEIDFLVFTVFENDDYVFHALQTGAIGYVLKTDRGMGAVQAIREYLDGGAPMSRHIARKVLQSFHQHKKKKIAEFASLTNKQLMILEQIAQGLLNKEIADRLGIQESTVKQHNYAIFRKLQVNNRTEAAQKYMHAQS